MNTKCEGLNNEQSTISYRFTMNQPKTMNNELRTMNQLMQNEPNLLSAKMNLSEVVLISRPWRIPQNNQSSTCAQGIINNQLKGITINQPRTTKSERQATIDEKQKNAKQTQFRIQHHSAYLAQRSMGHGSRPTSHEQICKTNPISKLQELCIKNRETRICKTKPIQLQPASDEIHPSHFTR